MATETAAPKPAWSLDPRLATLVAWSIPFRIAATWRGEIQAYWTFTTPLSFALCGAMTIEFHSHAPGEACNE